MTMDFLDNKRSQKPAHISSLLEKVVSSFGLSKQYYGWWVSNNWATIVGDHYARHSKALRFEDGTLIIAVEDPSWRQMMQLDKEKILALIHGYPHGRVVRDIRTVWGKKGF